MKRSRLIGGAVVFHDKWHLSATLNGTLVRASQLLYLVQRLHTGIAVRT